MMRLTLSVICEVLFKADIQEGQMRQQLEQAMDYFHEVMGVEVRSTIPIPDWTPIPRKRRLRASVSALNKIVNDLVVERRAAEDADGSMLTMLLSLKNDAGEPAMSDKQITDECITIFMAGHETSALVLTWACYLLAKYPDVQDRIRAEVDAVLGDRQPTLADLSQLTYTTMVLKETMRMYPPGWILGREAVEPAKIGDYDIAVGSLIFISPYLFHRDERFFEDAQTFKPERFDPAVEKQIQKYTFLPFSAGPRVCMGAGFAMMEMPIALATIVQQFCVETISSEEIEILPALTLMPASPVNIRFHKRQ
jgi:cytochrome P450